MINFPFKESITKLYLKVLPYYHRLYVFRLRYKDKINVVFFAANLSMWRYQHLYELMSKHMKFNVYIVISPFPTYTASQRLNDVIELRNYFSNQNIPYIDYDIENETNVFDVKHKLKPDILFYPQYYIGSQVLQHSSWKFKKKLVCAYPYAFNNIYDSFAYKNVFHTIAWKLFYPTLYSLNDAKTLADNKGKNIVITGYPNADDFLSDKFTDVWKKQKLEKKKIIWAPHFTIEKGLSPLYFSTFLNFCDFMQDLTIKYSCSIQFAFKPHPRLLTSLYKHEKWGKERTDEYYNWWQTQENTQLDTGDFINLFKTSDAMIHDCGSFSIEYFYTKKPALFLTRDLEEIKQNKNEVGKEALDTHYIGKTKEDIIQFIDNVVLQNIDPMKEQREKFFNKNLLPPNGKTVAQNTMDNILKTLRIK